MNCSACTNFIAAPGCGSPIEKEMKKRAALAQLQYLAPLLRRSWDNWDGFYNTIIKNVRIIKESGIAAVLRVANGRFVYSADYPDTNTSKEQE
jgi:hypothetical protein